MSLRLALLPSAILFTTLASASVFGAEIATDRLTFTGATAPGVNSITFENNVYSFRFVGDETITYQLDLSDPKVQGAQIIVKELTSDCRPIDGGGFCYRAPGNAVWFPKDLYKKTTLVSHGVSGNTVTLDYLLTFNGPHPVRYQYTLEGKVLRVRVTDPIGNLQYIDNFAGLHFGETTGVENPIPIHMQGALAQPLILFRKGTQHYFTANMLDMFQSNAADYGIVDTFNPQKGADWIRHNFDTVVQYKLLSNGKLAAPLDDTFFVVATGRVKDALITSTAAPSPYHSLLATRCFINAPEKVWSYYSGMFDLYESLGMYNIAGYFFKWSASINDPPANQNVGPDWAPAMDSANFSAMLAKGKKFGALLGAYQAYNCLPPTAPAQVSNAAQLVKDSSGNTKPYLQLGFPLVGVEAAGQRALAEGQAMVDLGMNAAYLDIHTYGSISKGPDGDHLDQSASSPWAKTNRVAFLSQKSWFDEMRTLTQGPLMGEGSIGTPNTNMEFLYYGVVDSVQRVINTGAGKQSIEFPAGSLSTPTLWPIIPEYEWRVAARHQVNHGNGFYDRFFHVGDGPAIVNPTTKKVITPLTQEARDLYQAMALAYGHAGFIMTNGTQTPTAQGYLTHATAADTYFLTNALQPFLFISPTIAIHYYYQGAWRTFEQILFQAESINPFRQIPVAITLASGARVYVNNGPSSLTVTVEGLTYVLPPRTGWIANVPGWVLAFSAIPPTTGGKRIDYVKAAGQYEYLNGRGNVTSYGSLSTPHKRLVYKVHTAGISVIENASGVLETTTSTPPTMATIFVLPTAAQLEVGDRSGVRAMAYYSNGSFRDVTTLYKWTTSNPQIAEVNNSGVVVARAVGNVTISVAGPAGVNVMPLTFVIKP